MKFSTAEIRSRYTGTRQLTHVQYSGSSVVQVLTVIMMTQ